MVGTHIEISNRYETTQYGKAKTNDRHRINQMYICDFRIVDLNYRIICRPFYFLHHPCYLLGANTAIPQLEPGIDNVQRR